MQEKTRREAVHALTFAGKFLFWMAVVLLSLWSIGFAFQISRWVGYAVLAGLAVLLYATAHIWKRWVAALWIFGVFNSLIVLETHRGVNNPAPVSTGAALLMLLYFSVGYFISNWYGEDEITPLDRCAFIVYLTSIILAAALDPHVSREPVVVTGTVLYPLLVGMAAIVSAFTIHRLRRTGG